MDFLQRVQIIPRLVGRARRPGQLYAGVVQKLQHFLDSGKIHLRASGKLAVIEPSAFDGDQLQQHAEGPARRGILAGAQVIHVSEIRLVKRGLFIAQALAYVVKKQAGIEVVGKIRKIRRDGVSFQVRPELVNRAPGPFGKRFAGLA